MRAAALVAVLLATSVAQAQQEVVDVEDVFPGVTFSSPVGVVLAPGQPGRYYVVEQGGGGAPSRILTLEPGDASPTVFLDLSDRTQAGGEAGLLGLAFHPDYEQNGRLFVYYTAPTPTPEPNVRVFVSRVSEFARSGTDPLQADPASETVLLEVDQPASNHNGGKIAFGPDGTLYIGLGDGGGGGDPFGNGQDVTTLLGALLRIDVDDVPEGTTYGIPDDNPFAATDGPERDEIYAYGLRNPWKFSLTSTGEIWLGDVGQGSWEEIDVIEAGGNYGWNEVEGPICYSSGSSCDLSAYEAPVYAYPHGEQTGRSITGGFVVEVVSELVGDYVYGDFVSGRVWALTPGTEEPRLLLDEVPNGSGGTRSINVSSIDPDENGVPLVTDYGGRVYRLLASHADPVEPGAGAASGSVRLVGPNPFRDATALEVEAVPGATIAVDVYDALGREVARLYEGPMPPSTLRLTLDGRALAPGVYVVRLATADARVERRLVRLR